MSFIHRRLIIPPLSSFHRRRKQVRGGTYERLLDPGLEPTSAGTRVLLHTHSRTLSATCQADGLCVSYAISVSACSFSSLDAMCGARGGAWFGKYPHPRAAASHVTLGGPESHMSILRLVSVVKKACSLALVGLMYKSWITSSLIGLFVHSHVYPFFEQTCIMEPSSKC